MEMGPLVSFNARDFNLLGQDQLQLITALAILELFLQIALGYYINAPLAVAKQNPIVLLVIMALLLPIGQETCMFVSIMARNRFILSSA